MIVWKNWYSDNDIFFSFFMHMFSSLFGQNISGFAFQFSIITLLRIHEIFFKTSFFFEIQIEPDKGFSSTFLLYFCERIRLFLTTTTYCRFSFSHFISFIAKSNYHKWTHTYNVSQGLFCAEMDSVTMESKPF